MLSAIDVKAALMVRVAPPTWMALRCRELVHNTVVTLTGLQLEPACWCGCCTLLLPVLAAARLALSSGLLVGVFTMAAVVLAVQVCLSSTRSLVGGKALAYVRDGDLVVCSDVIAQILVATFVPLCESSVAIHVFSSRLVLLDLILPFYLDLLETSRSTLELLAFGARLA